MKVPTPEPRTAVMILVEVTWEDQNGTVQAAPARMENRSAHGACIRLKSRISVGARLSIASHREQFSGVARHCRADGKDFVVGIQKDAVHRPLVKPKPVQDVPKREAAGERAEAAAVPRAQLSGRRKTDAVPRGNRARIETPIAQRLMVQQMQGQDAPLRPEAQAMRQPPPAAQTQGGQGFEGKQAKKGRSFMKLKWFAGNEEELLGGDVKSATGNGTPANEPPQRAAEAPQRVERRVVAALPEAGPNVPGFDGELLAMEDIYRAAGITSPRRGYSITKVVEMLRSEHLRGQSREVRRAAVLMALDAAGVTVDEVLQDAKARQEAIDAYAAEQRKHAETQWARKAEENIQIQAELEQVRALYAEKIRRNLDGVAREKATFGAWLKMKEQETQGMTEAVEQVLKAPPPAEAAADPLLSVTVSSATGKPV